MTTRIFLYSPISSPAVNRLNHLFYTSRHHSCTAGAEISLQEAFSWERAFGYWCAHPISITIQCMDHWCHLSHTAPSLSLLPWKCNIRKCSKPPKLSKTVFFFKIKFLPFCYILISQVDGKSRCYHTRVCVCVYVFSFSHHSGYYTDGLIQSADVTNISLCEHLHMCSTTSYL